MPAADEAPQAGPEPTQAAGEAAAPKLPSFAEQARSALVYIKGKASKAGGPAPAPGTDAVSNVVRDNQKNLVYWDFRFYYLKRLLELAETVPQAEVRDLKPFLDATLQEIEQRPSNASVRSNVLAGTFLTIMSSLAVWVFKNFQNEILAYVRQLVK